MAQAEIQHEAAVHPGSDHMAPEPGCVRDTEVDNPLNFEIGATTLLEIGDMGIVHGLDYDLSTSFIDTAASSWGLGQ